MSENPSSYEDILKVIDDYFEDLNTRIEAIKGFCVAMLVENAVQNAANAKLMNQVFKFD